MESPSKIEKKQVGLFPEQTNKKDTKMDRTITKLSSSPSSSPSKRGRFGSMFHKWFNRGSTEIEDIITEPKPSIDIQTTKPSSPIVITRKNSLKKKKEAHISGLRNNSCPDMSMDGFTIIPSTISGPSSTLKMDLQNSPEINSNSNSNNSSSSTSMEKRDTDENTSSKKSPKTRRFEYKDPQSVDEIMNRLLDDAKILNKLKEFMNKTRVLTLLELYSYNFLLEYIKYKNDPVFRFSRGYLMCKNFLPKGGYQYLDYVSDSRRAHLLELSNREEKCKVLDNNTFERSYFDESSFDGIIGEILEYLKNTLFKTFYNSVYKK